MTLSKAKHSQFLLMPHTKGIILFGSTNDRKSCISLNTEYSAVGQLATEWVGLQHHKVDSNMRIFFSRNFRKYKKKEFLIEI